MLLVRIAVGMAQNGQAVLDLFAISDNALRVAHFMAQILHESGALLVQFENLNYSVTGLVAIWPARFAEDPDAVPREPNALALKLGRRPGQEADQRGIANAAYNGRMGNSAQGDDGWNENRAAQIQGDDAGQQDEDIQTQARGCIER